MYHYSNNFKRSTTQRKMPFSTPAERVIVCHYKQSLTYTKVHCSSLQALIQKEWITLQQDTTYWHIVWFWLPIFDCYFREIKVTFLSLFLKFCVDCKYWQISSCPLETATQKSKIHLDIQFTPPGYEFQTGSLECIYIVRVLIDF